MTAYGPTLYRSAVLEFVKAYFDDGLTSVDEIKADLHRLLKQAHEDGEAYGYRIGWREAWEDARGVEES